MIVRLFAAGVAFLVTVGVFAVVSRGPSAARRLSMEPQNTSTLARILNKARELSPSSFVPDWTVTRANSAHHVMVVEVEARRLEGAREIAVQIVAPVRSRGYEEILIYVRPIGGGIDAAMRRIQWTPRAGYVETIYDADRAPR